MTIAKDDQHPLYEDIIEGAAEIGAYLAMKPGRIYHLAERGGLPTFKIGKHLCARRSTLLRWIQKQEARRLQKESNLATRID
jgi:hypothetical protein